MLVGKTIFHKKLEIGLVELEFVTIFGVLWNLATQSKPYRIKSGSKCG